jgi:hypothetical protein
MSSNKIPGVPDGWDLVHANRVAEAGEFILTEEGNPYMSIAGSRRPFPIIRKIEKPAKYRPFVDSEEFKPHRDRWWYREEKGSRRHFPPASYSDNAHGGSVWQHRFETCFFDDGTPFGVKVQ